MSKLSKQQVQTLVGLISTTEPDSMSCDDCFGQISEYVELAVEEQNRTEGMKGIQRHLDQCPCCQNEYVALVEALKEVAA